MCRGAVLFPVTIYRIKRAVRCEAHHHRIYHAQHRSVPRQGTGEERGREQDDQRHHVAEDPRRDAVISTEGLLNVS